MNPDASRLLARILSYVDELTIDEAREARQLVTSIAPTFTYIEELPPILGRLYQKHEATLMAGLEVLARRP